MTPDLFIQEKNCQKVRKKKVRVELWPRVTFFPVRTEGVPSATLHEKSSGPHIDPFFMSFYRKRRWNEKSELLTSELFGQLFFFVLVGWLILKYTHKPRNRDNAENNQHDWWLISMHQWDWYWYAPYIYR